MDLDININININVNEPLHRKWSEMVASDILDRPNLLICFTLLYENKFPKVF